MREKWQHYCEYFHVLTHILHPAASCSSEAQPQPAALTRSGGAAGRGFYRVLSCSIELHYQLFFLTYTRMMNEMFLLVEGRDL